MKWIRPEKRMPDPGVQVLGYDGEQGATVACRDDGSWYLDDGCTCCCCFAYDRVIGWVPLPTGFEDEES